MGLSLGRHADYAIRATLDLALHEGGQLRKSRQIAAATGVPPSYLPQILAQLVRSGIARSTAGPRGGYSLASPAGEISVFEVVTAVDGDLEASVCVLRGGLCDGDPACAIHLPWARAQAALTGELASTTFAEVAEVDRLLALRDDELPAPAVPPAPISADA